MRNSKQQDPASEIVAQEAAPEAVVVNTKEIFEAPGKVDIGAFRRALGKLDAAQESPSIPYENPEHLDESVVEAPVSPETTDETIETEAFEAPQAEEVDEYADSKTIPKKRLNKEIEKRKSLESQLLQEREERIRAQTELDVYNRGVTKLTETISAPEPSIDPIDVDSHNYLERKLQAMEKRLAESENKSAQAVQMNQFTNAVNAQQAEYVRGNPDFDNAYSYLLDREMQNVMLLGASEQEAQQAVSERLFTMANHALQSGRNVPDMIYKMSKNYGYAGKANSRDSGPNLGNINKNHARSADATREVPAVATRLGSPSKAAIGLSDFEARTMNEGGKGVNESEFHRQLRVLRESAGNE